MFTVKIPPGWMDVRWNENLWPPLHPRAVNSPVFGARGVQAAWPCVLKKVFPWFSLPLTFSCLHCHFLVFFVLSLPLTLSPTSHSSRWARALLWKTPFPNPPMSSSLLNGSMAPRQTISPGGERRQLASGHSYWKVLVAEVSNALHKSPLVKCSRTARGWNQSRESWKAAWYWGVCTSYTHHWKRSYQILKVFFFFNWQERCNTSQELQAETRVHRGAKVCFYIFLFF